MLRWIPSAVGLPLLLLAASELPIRLGAPAPDWTVETVSGRQTTLLQHLREKKRDAVVLAPGGDGRLQRAELEDRARRLAQRDVELIVLPPGFSAGRLETPATILIDSGGAVRRIEPGRLLAGKELEEFVDQWRLGRDVFLTSCARCHGDDGALEICGDVKPLTGIGNRLTAQQVYERLRVGELGESDVLIRGRFYKRKEVEAVVVFVRGL